MNNLNRASAYLPVIPFYSLLHKKIGVIFLCIGLVLLSMGQVAGATQVVVLEDLPDKVLLCGEAVVFDEPAFSSDCEMIVRYVDEAIGEEGCNQAVVRTWSALEKCSGVLSQKSQKIIFKDEEAPVFAVVPEGGHVERLEDVAFDMVMAVDNCSKVLITSEDEVIGDICSGVLIRTWTASDLCGNASSASASMRYGQVNDRSDCKDKNEKTKAADTSGKTVLFQNEPNPFAEESTIAFYLPKSMKTTVNIFNASGQVLFTESKWYAKGRHEIVLQAEDFESAGLLYFQLKTPYEVLTKKMILTEN